MCGGAPLCATPRAPVRCISTVSKHEAEAVLCRRLCRFSHTGGTAYTEIGELTKLRKAQPPNYSTLQDAGLRKNMSLSEEKYSNIPVYCSKREIPKNTFLTYHPLLSILQLGTTCANMLTPTTYSTHCVLVRGSWHFW